MPSFEVVGKVYAAPSQITGMVNLGVTGVLTVIVMVVVVQHGIPGIAGIGVKVQVVVIELFTIAGDQFPIAPSFELEGNMMNATSSPSQIGAI